MLNEQTKEDSKMLNSLLQSKVVVIGASSWIGKRDRSGCWSRGEVMLSSRSAEKLNQLASAIGKQAKVIPVDDV